MKKRINVFYFPDIFFKIMSISNFTEPVLDLFPNVPLANPFAKRCKPFMKHAILLLFCMTFFAVTGCGTAGSSVADRNGVDPTAAGRPGNELFGFRTLPTAAGGLTGTYENAGGNQKTYLKIEQISQTELKVKFEGVIEFETEAGLNANTDESEVLPADLSGRTARIRTAAHPRCGLKLRFGDKSAGVEQRGSNQDCGFGIQISFAGNYRKISDAPPVWDETAAEEQTAPAQSVGENTIAERIRFARGASAATIAGEIRDNSTVSYLIGARAGQTMKVEILEGGAHNDVVFGVIAADGTRLDDDGAHSKWSRKLPKSGDYVITVSTIESPNAPFRLRVSIR